jgi:hypothetical protein
MTASCLSAQTFRYSPPIVKVYPIDTGDNLVQIGIQLPDETLASCHELVSYVARGSITSITKGKGAQTRLIPGISAGVYSLDWVFGVARHAENWETIYCDLSDDFVDTTGTPQPC